MTDTAPPAAPEAAPEAAPARLQIVRAGPVRLLRNLSDVEATVVAISSRTTVTYGSSGAATSAAPCVELRGLPGGTDVVVEAVDPYEDGHVSFSLVRAEWADGRTDLGRPGDPPTWLQEGYDPDPGGMSRLNAIATALQAGLPVPNPPAPRPRVALDLRTIRVAPGSVRLGPPGDPPRARAACAQAACARCAHALPAAGADLQCTHPAHNPHPDRPLWTVPGRGFACPVYHPHPDA